VASFTDPNVGISGLSAVVMALVLGRVLGFPVNFLSNGAYTYNVLLVGLTMGAYFRLDAVFFVVLLLASLITLLLSVWLNASLALKKLPMLSLPFILGIWIILLSTRHFHAMGLNERGIYLYNDLSSFGGLGFVSLYLHLNDLGLPPLLVVYLKSMGAIFFQNHIVSGLLITIGLLIFSRIAFSLSVIGFLSGYFFCTLVQGNLSDLEYSYIGFNYILTAMALGGFFLVPSIGSYLLAAVSAPLVSLFVGALSSVASGYMLSLYSLPFTLVVLLILHALSSRYRLNYLYPVQYQLFSPEKNLYLFRHYTERFRKEALVHIHLPFYGEWTVSQAHDGDPTHKDDWRYALDFVVTGDDQKTYRLPGQQLSDYYCYQLPVLAPADGEVVTIEDGISDNAIGDVDLQHNWGNAIIIRHSEHLYSKLSHLKKDSFRVKEGDRVKKGDVLGLCGSSGRSPEPHLHFQMQAVPYIGAKTLDYPLSYYVSRRQDVYRLHSFTVPAEGERVMRPMPTPLLTEAFHFIPGMKLEFEVEKDSRTETECWEVMTNSANLSYLYCAKTASSAWFSNNGTVFYFTSFSGDEESLLYYFYLGAQKILLSYYQDLLIEDHLPPGALYKGPLKFAQDLVAPFYVFLKTTFSARYVSADNAQSPSQLRIQSQVSAYAGSGLSRSVEVELLLADHTISHIIIKEKNRCFSARHIG
jgi:murein DD-endopeptidase MepM/ murein hydrolase activator NlpD